MALKVKAVERLLKFDKESAGHYRYVMKAYFECRVQSLLRVQSAECRVQSD